MMGRFIAATVIASAMLIVAHNDGNSHEQQIKQTSRSAVLAWMDEGAPGLYDYLTSETKGWCPSAKWLAS